jgi:hypothetical protein
MEASVKKVCEDSTCSCTSAQTRTYGELRNPVSVHHSYPKRRTDTGLPAVAGCSLETQSLNVQPLSGDPHNDMRKIKPTPLIGFRMDGWEDDPMDHGTQDDLTALLDAARRQFGVSSSLLLPLKTIRCQLRQFGVSSSLLLPLEDNSVSVHH